MRPHDQTRPHRPGPPPRPRPLGRLYPGRHLRHQEKTMKPTTTPKPIAVSLHLTIDDALYDLAAIRDHKHMLLGYTLMKIPGGPRYDIDLLVAKNLEYRCDCPDF